GRARSLQHRELTCSQRITSNPNGACLQLTLRVAARRQCLQLELNVFRPPKCFEPAEFCDLCRFAGSEYLGRFANPLLKQITEFLRLRAILGRTRSKRMMLAAVRTISLFTVSNELFADETSRPSTNAAIVDIRPTASVTAPINSSPR
ncbi:hypothetical protein, partial [Caballeronia terrestris]|uniref:hypothetical protein n=1 Tax=Caballeronia terrestris TaxID=1226301 RepID=UPI001F480989